MATLPSEIVGEAHQSTHHWDVLCDLVDINNRMAGQTGERQAAERLADAFDSNGLREVEISDFEIAGWWRGSSSLSVEYGGVEQTFEKDYQTIALPRTPNGETEAELVDVGYGRPKDFERVDCRGKIVMASNETPDSYGRQIHRGEKYAFAANHGAAAFVFRNHIDGCLPPTGNVGDGDGPGPIHAIGVSKEVGTRLVRYCEAGTIEASLRIDCRNEPTTSRNVKGVVGPDTDKEVLVVGHVDGHDIAEGANDNGVGSVLTSEVGRLLAGIEDRLETKVICLVVGSEEVGLYGSYHWIESHPNEQVKCVFNMDAIGFSRDLTVHTHRSDELGVVFEEVATEYSLPIEITERILPYSDHWPFVQRGIPGILACSVTDGLDWVHTHADTLDKLDVRDLRALSVPIAAATVKAAQADREIPPKPIDEIREGCIEDELEEGMRNYGGWPFDETEDAV